MPTKSERGHLCVARLSLATFAILVAALSTTAGQCPCYVILPDCSDATLDCPTLETWVYCLAQCCAQNPDQAPALRQQCAGSLPYSCPDLGCGLSCDLLQNCESNGSGGGGSGGGGGGNGGGLATEWVVIIALVSALMGVAAMSAFLALIWRRRTTPPYETLN